MTHRAVGSCALVAFATVSACERSDAGRDSPSASVVRDAGTDAGAARAARLPRAESDACEQAGYFFDGSSDCDVVRCPELTCDCPDTSTTASSSASRTLEVTLSACAPSAGCLDVVSCDRVCDPSFDLMRTACEARIQTQRCSADDDCLLGGCRQESVGAVCPDTMGCLEDGHCGDESRCLIDPGTLDEESSQPTELGACSNGREGAPCFDADDCVYGNCQGTRCTGGLPGEACRFNDQCASGLCRIRNETDESGQCVTGEPGDVCTDDDDCADSLHCSGGACFGNGVGQNCDVGTQCMSGICVSSRCRAGEIGSWCEEEADCVDGFCVQSRCASGELLAPCVDAGDCTEGMLCAGQRCSDGSEGLPCATDEECTVLACVRGACSEGADGTVCEVDEQCQSERCARPAGASPGTCTSGEAGSACVRPENCESETCSPNGRCQ